MKPLWKVKGFGQADIMEKTSFFHDKIEQKRVMPTCTCTSFCTCRCKTWESQESKTRVYTTHHHTRRVMVTPAFYTHLFWTTLTFRADVATPAVCPRLFEKFHPHWHSELCVEVASCQHHLRPSQEKKRQRGASSTCEQQFAVRSWADLPWHCLSRNFKCNSVLNSREDVKRSNTWKQRKHEHVPPGTFGRIV